MRRMRLRAFPAVRRSDHEAGRSWQALWQRWRDAPHAPLRVAARLAGSHVPGVDGALHLDGVLSAAALDAGPGGAITVRLPERFAVPLPLMLLWASPDGDPLWAATDFRPAIDGHGAGAGAGEIYIHRRYPADRAALADRPSVLTAAGRHKDVRLPIAVAAVPELEAWCLGLEREMRELVGRISHLGRKGSIGQGRVLAWTVEPAPAVDPAWILERRMVPLAALGPDVPVAAGRIAPRGAWTPPYWDAARHAPCRAPRWAPP